MIVDLLFAESTVGLKRDWHYQRAAINPFGLFHTCSALHNSKLLKHVAWKSVTLKVAPYTIRSPRSTRSRFFMPLEEAALVRTVVLDSEVPVIVKEETDNLASYFPSLTKFIFLHGAQRGVSWIGSDLKLKEAFHACVAAETGIQVCPLELIYKSFRQDSAFGEVWGHDHFFEKDFIAVFDFFPRLVRADWTCGCRAPVDSQDDCQYMQNMSLETHHAYFHLSLIFIHASHEDFSLWQSKMSTSRIGLSWPDRRGWTRFLAVETLPLETHEHNARYLEREVVFRLYSRSRSSDRSGNSRADSLVSKTQTNALCDMKAENGALRYRTRR